MNAQELAQAAKASNPQMRFAYHADSCVGVYNEAINRFQMCYSRALGIDGFVRTETEILINGAPPVGADEWVEV